MVKHINQKQIYAEVYAVLSVLGGEYIRKIPQNVLNTIAEQRDKDYSVSIDKEQSLGEQNLSEEAIAILAVLKLDYWCETEEEKNTLQDILNLNEEKYLGKPLSINSKKAWINMIKNSQKNKIHNKERDV